MTAAGPLHQQELVRQLAAAWVVLHWAPPRCSHHQPPLLLQVQSGQTTQWLLLMLW